MLPSPITPIWSHLPRRFFQLLFSISGAFLSKRPNASIYSSMFLVQLTRGRKMEAIRPTAAVSPGRVGVFRLLWGRVIPATTSTGSSSSQQQGPMTVHLGWAGETALFRLFHLERWLPTVAECLGNANVKCKCELFARRVWKTEVTLTH